MATGTPQNIEGSATMIIRGTSGKEEMAGPVQADGTWPTVACSEDYLRECFADRKGAQARYTYQIENPDGPGTAVAVPQF